MLVHATVSRTILPAGVTGVKLSATLSRDNFLANGFCKEEPSLQTALDIFKDAWWTSMPANSGLKAGSIPNLEDTRCSWVDARFPLLGKSVLELGPFEAYNTLQLSRLTCRRVDAVEANRFNYLKCLIMKEVLGFDASIHHGDISAYLRRPPRFDAIWASGVLYHQIDPIEMLRLCSDRSDILYIWTHYHDEACSDSSGFDRSKNTKKQLDGKEYQYHFRSYDLANFEDDVTPNWSAGTAPYANWLDRDDLLRVLSQLGFTKIEREVDGVRLLNLPVISLLARRE